MKVQLSHVVSLASPLPVHSCPCASVAAQYFYCCYSRRNLHSIQRSVFSNDGICWFTTTHANAEEKTTQIYSIIIIIDSSSSENRKKNTKTKNNNSEMEQKDIVCVCVESWFRVYLCARRIHVKSVESRQCAARMGQTESLPHHRIHTHIFCMPIPQYTNFAMTAAVGSKPIGSMLPSRTVRVSECSSRAAVQRSQQWGILTKALANGNRCVVRTLC